MFFTPTSFATDLVSPMQPCLLAAYSAPYWRPIKPNVLAALTMEPPSSANCGISARNTA